MSEPPMGPRSRAAKSRAAKVEARRERRQARQALAAQTQLGSAGRRGTLPSEVLPDLQGLPRVGGEW